MANTLIYQMVWKIEPGLRGLACREFKAVPTEQPDNERGVAVELSTDAERDALLRDLETDFAGIRFSNGAAAFETAKSYILDWIAKKKSGTKDDAAAQRTQRGAEKI